MEQVLFIDYVKDMILDKLTIKEFNHMRACSKSLQSVVSEYSEKKMESYIIIINRKITQLRPNKLYHCFETSYIVLYNYYHTIIMYSCLVLDIDRNVKFKKLMRCLHAKKSIHLGHMYIFDTSQYKKTDTKKYSYSLFDIMTCNYLYNTGSDWTSYHWSGEGLDEMKYLQGKLLPLS